MKWLSVAISAVNILKTAFANMYPNLISGNAHKTPAEITDWNIKNSAMWNALRNFIGSTYFTWKLPLCLVIVCVQLMCYLTDILKTLSFEPHYSYQVDNYSPSQERRYYFELAYRIHSFVEQSQVTCYYRKCSGTNHCQMNSKENDLHKH